MREAPALVLIDKLLEAGCKVRAYDPAAVQECKRRIGDTIYFSPVEENEDSYYCHMPRKGLPLTIQPHFSSSILVLYKDTLIKKTMSQQIVLDGRNIYDKKEMEELGFVYHCIGK